MRAPVLRHGALAPALALGLAPAAHGDVRVGIGLVALRDADPYLGVEDAWSALPLPLLETGRLSVFGPRAAFRLAGGGTTALELVAGWNFAGFEATDSEALAGLEDRDGSLLAGFALTREGALGELALDVLGDVADTHGGAVATLTAARPFAVAGGRLVPSLALRWQGAGYRAYYFGVSGEEVTAALPAHAPGAGVDLELGLGWTRPLGAHHRVLLDAVATALADSVADGPLVEDDLAVRLAAGWLYEF